MNGPTRVRYLMLALVGLAPACAYLTRIISAFATTIGDEYEISNEAVGEIIAGFALGYFLFQVPGGILATWFGVRLVLPFMSTAWCLCAILGSYAVSPGQLYGSRVLMGVAQAALVPCCAKVASDWFPIHRRGVISAVLTASMQIGGIVATGLSARLLESVGWRNLLLSYALFGLGWSALFWLLFRNSPDEDPRTNERERELIRAGRTVPPKVMTPLPTSRLLVARQLTLLFLTSVSFWAYCLQATCRAYGYEFFTSWFPAYLEKAFALDKAAAGELASWPLIAFTVGALAGGVVVDWIFISTGSRWWSRCGLSAVVMLLAAGSFLLGLAIDDATFVVFALSMSCLFSAMAGATTWAAGMDIGGKHTAVVFGVMNMVGNIGSYLCPGHVGKIFDYVEATSASYHLALWLFVGVYVVGAILWLFVDPRRPIAE